MKRLAILVTLLCGTSVLADEGMWTYDNFPASKVKEKYGFEPSQAWLDYVRLSSAQLDGDCSGGFISPNGLVMTNHHCARGCIERLSTAKKDLISQGFYAQTQAEEVQCPAMELDQLVELTDVTGTLNAATQGLTGKEYSDALKQEMAKLEKACATSEQVHCQVVTLYQGGRYSLYKYRRFQDVRLVFAPEEAIASFGGDPDNCEFPRYDLDLALLRIYQDGKPVKTDHYFKWSERGAQEGELTFVSGQPGKTSRGLTVAQLEFQRDVALPRALAEAAERRGYLTGFRERGPEQKRISGNALFFAENYLKTTKGRLQALTDARFFGQKVSAEQELRRKVDENPELKKKYGSAWEEIARTQGALRDSYDELRFIEGGQGFSSNLFTLARTLVRSAEELPKDNARRLREYTDANLPGLQAGLFSSAPIYPELEIAKLTFSLTKLREVLGPDHPFVRKVLGKESPRMLATRVVQGTTLRDPKARKLLFEGGQKAIEASQDPMIQLARLVDPDARAIRKNYEENIDAVIQKNSERVAQARFEVYGTHVYPDATATLRLSYGSVRGYTEEGRAVRPFTTLGETFERHTGQEPFALPPSWLKNRKALEVDQPFDFVANTDIIGGNSGSPMLDRNAEIIGLVFDTNIQGLGGEYGFDESVNRTVAVHSSAILQALDKVYGAHRVLEEIRPGAPESRM